MSSDRTTVLLVEDDQNIVDLVRSNLIARAHDVVVSKDGSDAVAMLEASEPDAILLDLMLPGIDGFELCRELRERSSVGIIVLSARRAETDKVRALNLGADAVGRAASLQHQAFNAESPRAETSFTSPLPSSPCCASSSRTRASS